MPFEKGRKKTGGRKSGSANVVTTSVRETVLKVFQELQADDSPVNLKKWATKEPTEFYRMASKLIPTDLKAELTGENGGPIEQKFEITLKL